VAYLVTGFGIYSPQNGTLLPNEEFFINITGTIRSKSRTPPILKIRRLGPLLRTQVDNKVWWVTDDSVELSVLKRANILCLLTLLYLSTISTQRVCMSLVMATKNSDKYLMLETVEMDIEDVLAASANGNNSE
jgi:hypothetical protein